MSISTGTEMETSVLPTPVDYFGFQSNEKYYLPDGNQYIEFSLMNEGAKANFQKLTTRDLIVQRGGDARMKMDPAAERHTLITQSVKDWNVYRGGIPVPFSTRALKDFLELANPVIVEELEKAIRKANPWLLGEMKSEDIEKEIENLQEMLVVAKERELGEAGSSSK